MLGIVTRTQQGTSTPFDEYFKIMARPVSLDAYEWGYIGGWENNRSITQGMAYTHSSLQEEFLMGVEDGTADRLAIAQKHHALLQRCMYPTGNSDLDTANLLEASNYVIKKLYAH